VGSVRRRSRIARGLVVAAALVLFLALIAGYARHALVDSDQFANRAAAALRSDAVRTLIAERITDQVVLANQADLLTARPIIESVAADVVGSAGFSNLFGSAVRDVHRALFLRDQNTLTLTVADVGTVLAAALQALRPSLADELERTGRISLITRDIGSLSGRMARIADAVKVIALLLALAGAALIAAAIWVSPDRRRTVGELGVGAAAAGVLLVVALAVVRAIAVHRLEDPDEQAAAGAVWDAFLADLRNAGLIVAGSGAVIAAAAASLIKPLELGEPLRRAGAWLRTEPVPPAARALRGAVFVAAGALVLVARDATLQLLVTVLGVYLVYEGVSALLRLVYRAPPEHEEAKPRRVRRRLVAPAVAAVLVAGAAAVFLASGGTSTAAPATGGCNGHLSLCGRPLDEVALAATHNSMSAPLPGWFSSQQDAPIPAQLDDGIRGLLIDTHYADRLPNGKLRTYFGSEHSLKSQARRDGVSPAAIDAAMRLRERLGFSGEGERGMYLCHTFCELGAITLASALDDLHAFLVAHPGDVVVVINQDYVTPEDFVKAVDDAGLGDLAYAGPTDRWPTLREMIDSGSRVVFLAENHAGAAPWYHLAYERITKETPFSFSSTGQLTSPAKLAASCAPNRGPEDAPIFLVNHWITTDPAPRPSNASVVNAFDPLLARMRECQRIRRHLPNLVAVDFYRRGDVFEVVDTLNGVSGGEASETAAAKAARRPPPSP
jgi:hypothetical protein